MTRTFKNEGEHEDDLQQLHEYVAQMCELFGDNREEMACDAWRLLEHVTATKAVLQADRDQLDALRAELGESQAALQRHVEGAGRQEWELQRALAMLSTLQTDAEALTTERDEAEEAHQSAGSLWAKAATERDALRAELATALQQCAKVAALPGQWDEESTYAKDVIPLSVQARGVQLTLQECAKELRAALATDAPAADATRVVNGAVALVGSWRNRCDSVGQHEDELIRAVDALLTPSVQESRGAACEDCDGTGRSPRECEACNGSGEATCTCPDEAPEPDPLCQIHGYDEPTPSDNATNVAGESK
jgi:hypothetical protein